MKIHWRLKAILPVAGVLLAGLLAFLWVTFPLHTPERRAVILVASLGAIVISAVILVVLAVLVQRPLAELQQKIARVQEGDLSVRVSFASPKDEIGELGEHFNAMVRQLRESREEIERLYRTQMSRAEHLATLGELAAGLAHEIRNPLAGIAGVIEIIGRDLPATSPSREVLADVQREVLHIQQILSELLDYARPRPPELRAADLRATAEHAFHLIRQQALSRPLRFSLQAPPSAVLVEHDAAQIQQVLVNLLLNALQAIPESGTVNLKVEARDGAAVLAVEDNGRGIPAENLGHIFRPFYTTKGKGTGLGLSLARRIVEGHGGRIEAESKPGTGSCFRVWLPLLATRSTKTVAPR